MHDVAGAIMVIGLGIIVSVWFLIVAVKQGFSEHIKAMQAIYEEICNANRAKPS